MKNAITKKVFFIEGIDTFYRKKGASKLYAKLVKTFAVFYTNDTDELSIDPKTLMNLALKSKNLHSRARNLYSKETGRTITFFESIRS